MIRYLRTSDSGFRSPLAIAPEAIDGTTWLTVFIAENGGRKSLLLRLLSEAALGSHRYRPNMRKGSERFTPQRSFALEPLRVRPDRVIAISGTPLDRFPRTGTTDLKSQGKRRPVEGSFVYLGPRASNGMAGVAQSERSLVGSFISNRHRLRNVKGEISKVFTHLSLQPRFSVSLRATEASRGSVRSSLLRELARSSERPRSEDDLARLQEMREALSELTNSNSSRLEEALSRVGAPYATLEFDGAQVHARSRLISVAAWELLMRAGIVEVDSTHFYRRTTSKHRAELAGEQLSSGQWNWLGCFAPLLVETRPNSLILVDEPENSLHPSWQRLFMPELRAVLAKFPSCQAVVATHSPLIASGVSAEWGNVQTLTRADRVDALVESVSAPTAYGWNATDVYGSLFSLKSTRNPAFIEPIDRALRIVARTEEAGAKVIAELVDTLHARRAQLPAFDPLREVLSEAIQALRGKTL